MRFVEKKSLVELDISSFSEEIRKDFDVFLKGSEEYKEYVRTLQGQASNKLNQDWYQKTQKILLAIYHNKCAFCEREFSHEVGNKKPSVEHFRPKNKNLYYWLAVEWTNLVPSCLGCNNPKGDKFTLANKELKVNNPFTDENQLDECLFDAKYLHQIECPNFLHPEIDNPTDFFFFDKNGEIQAINNSSRANEMIKELKLNDAKDRQSLVLARKKVLENIRKELESQTYRYLSIKNKQQNLNESIENDMRSLAFDSLFEKIITNAYNPKIEFSLLHYLIFADFNMLIVEPIAREIADKADFDVRDSIKNEVLDSLNDAFRLFVLKALN